MGESGTDTQAKGDEQVLADPESANVDEVLDVFARSTPEQVVAAKEVEKAAKKPRKTILDWERPISPEESQPVRDVFPLERVLGPDGPAITGQPVYVIAGAFHGESDDAEYTRDEIAKRISDFLNRPVGVDTSEQEG